MLRVLPLLFKHWVDQDKGKVTESFQGAAWKPGHRRVGPMHFSSLRQWTCGREPPMTFSAFFISSRDPGLQKGNLFMRPLLLQGNCPCEEGRSGHANNLKDSLFSIQNERKGLIWPLGVNVCKVLWERRALQWFSGAFGTAGHLSQAWSGWFSSLFFCFPFPPFPFLSSNLWQLWGWQVDWSYFHEQMVNNGYKLRWILIMYAFSVICWIFIQTLWSIFTIPIL